MKALGDDYENRAAQWLQARGLRVLARNFRARTGEIDLIALDRTHLVFCEVRARRNRCYGTAAGTVDLRKQRRLLHTAQFFIQRHPQLAHLPCRFDVIAFQPPQSGSDLDIHWIPGAFTS